MTKCPAGHDIDSCSCLPAQDQIDAAAVAASVQPPRPEGPPFPLHPGDQYANLCARVAARERWTASLLSPAMLQNRVHELEQRLDLHVSAQTDVHGLSCGLTADRLAAIEARLNEKKDILRQLLTPSPSPTVRQCPGTPDEADETTRLPPTPREWDQIIRLWRQANADRDRFQRERDKWKARAETAEAELEKARAVDFSVLETYRKRAEKAETDLADCRRLLLEAAEWLKAHSEK